jgi:hypothetical protein
MAHLEKLERAVNVHETTFKNSARAIVNVREERPPSFPTQNLYVGYENGRQANVFSSHSVRDGPFHPLEKEQAPNQHQHHCSCRHQQ